MSKLLISLVVPIYNSEKYLAKCLASIQSQSYTDLEVILVNDGSTDSSEQICEDFAKGDERFIVVSKVNGGVSSARNVGLNMATGSYIGFIDADDYIDQDMIANYARLYMQFKPDIIMCGIFKETANGTLLNKRSKVDCIEQLSANDALKRVLNKDEFHGYACNKLFSIRLLRENQIFFDEDIHICEDMLFCCQCFVIAKSIVYDKARYYHYVFHGSNNSASFNSKALTALDAYEQIITLLQKEKLGNMSGFVTSYVQTNISLLMQSISSEKLGPEYYTLKNNLLQFNASDMSSWKIKIAYFLAKKFPNVLRPIWSLRRKIC